MIGTATLSSVAVSSAAMAFPAYRSSIDANEAPPRTASKKAKAKCSVNIKDTPCRIKKWDSKANKGTLVIPSRPLDEFRLTVDPGGLPPYTVPVKLVAPGDGGPIKDCTASISCGDGTTASCTGSGKLATCNSTMTTISCFSVNNDGEIEGITGACAE